MPENRPRLIPQIRVYFYDKTLIPKIATVVSKTPGARMVTLPLTSRTLTLRKAPGGDGYATYERYAMKKYKVLITLPDIKNFQRIITKLDQKGLYLDARIT